MYVTLIAPKGTLDHLAWRKLKFGVGDDGTLTVPLFAAEELINTGCTLKEPKVLPPHDLVTELQKSNSQDIHTFLASRGITPTLGNDADNMQRALWLIVQEQLE